MTGDGGYKKVPKGHITKLLLNPMQMMAESIDGQGSSTGWGIAVDMFSNINPVDMSSTMPVILKLIAEPIANYDFYWRQSIEKDAQRGLPAGERFDKRTSETFKTIGRALNISPIMMQHELRTVFAGAGTNVLWAADAILYNKQMEFSASRAPIVRRFWGKAEEWGRDISQRKRELGSRLREIQEARRGGARKLSQYYGYSKEDVLRAYKKSAEEMEMIHKKMAELDASEIAIKQLTTRLKKQ